MEIENLRYDVLSKGLQDKEVAPQPGDFFKLNVRKNNRVDLPGNAEDMGLNAEYVEAMGPYTHVIGLGELEDKILRFQARYNTSNFYPKNTPIGELFFQRVVNESSEQSPSA